MLKTMKTWTGICLLVGFGVLSLAGLFTMGYHGASGCFAAAASGETCPEGAGPLALADFHLKPFRNFSESIAIQSVISILALALWAAALFYAQERSRIQPAWIRSIRAYAGRRAAKNPRWLSAWLALLEKRDPAPVR